MKRNQIDTLLLVILLGIISTIHAQQKPPMTAEELAAKTTEWMKTTLSLNEDQSAQVHDINLKYAKRNLDLKDSKLGKRQKLQTLKSNEDAKDAELKKVFTTDQYKTWEVKKEEIKAQLKEKRKKG